MLDRRLAGWHAAAMALLGASAFFAGSACGQHVGGWLFPLAPGALPGRVASTLPTSAPTFRSADRGNVILERNPFDSVTGPILERGELASEAADAGASTGEPLACPGLARVLATVVDPMDRGWSFATLSRGDPAEFRMVRNGRTVFGRRVVAILPDRVYLEEAGRTCLVSMSEPNVRAVAGSPGSRATSGDSKTSGDGAGAALAQGIRRIDDGHFALERKVLESILEQQGALMATTKIAPETVDGKVVGVRLVALGSGNVLRTLGLLPGDVIQSINGFGLTSPEAALQAYARLHGSQRLSMAVIRGGTPRSIDYDVQ